MRDEKKISSWHKRNVGRLPVELANLSGLAGGADVENAATADIRHDIPAAAVRLQTIRRPDPLPAIFGYHEVFHAFVIGAVALQYGSVALVVLD